MDRVDIGHDWLVNTAAERNRPEQPGLALPLAHGVQLAVVTAEEHLHPAEPGDLAIGGQSSLLNRTSVAAAASFFFAGAQIQDVDRAVRACYSGGAAIG